MNLFKHPVTGFPCVVVGDQLVELQPLATPTAINTAVTSTPQRPKYLDYDNIQIQCKNGTVMSQDIYAGKVKVFHPTLCEDTRTLLDQGYLDFKNVDWAIEPLSKRSKKAYGCRKDGTAISFKYGKGKPSYRVAHLCVIDK